MEAFQAFITVSPELLADAVAREAVFVAAFRQAVQDAGGSAAAFKRAIMMSESSERWVYFRLDGIARRHFCN